MTLFLQIISIISIVTIGAFIIREDLRLVWNDLLDWAIDVIERGFEANNEVQLSGERFPLGLRLKCSMAWFLLDFDARLLRCGRYWNTVRVYYKYHQKAQKVYGKHKWLRIYPYHQLWFRRWWTVPGFVYEFYCWQRVYRSERYAMKLQRERRWE
jgi:hypothetical protein